ncbi:hypothetical protein D3C84_848030 [compost metagenome]
MTNHEKVLELREQINNWTKQTENLEDVIEEAYHRIDELSVNEDELITLNKEQLHKIISILDHSIVPNDGSLADSERKTLYDYKEGIVWDIAESFGYDLNKGTVDPTTLEFKKFR